jgi:hypothetical protein
MKRLAATGAWLLVACATQPATPSAFEPAFGHHQPLPTESPTKGEPAPEHQQPPPPESDDTAARAEPEVPTSEEVADPSSMLPTAEEDALCRHIVKLVQSESGSLASSEETDELILNCGLALAHDRRRMGMEEFERRAACMRAATTVADFAACVPSETPELGQAGAK